MHLVMNRDITIKGLSGHAIHYKKGEPTYTPPELVSDAMAAGAVPAEGEVVTPAEDQPAESRPVPVGAEREKVIIGVFEEMIKDNNRTDFTAGGVPKDKVVNERLWFKVDRTEIKDLWYKYKAGEIGEND